MFLIHQYHWTLPENLQKISLENSFKHHRTSPQNFTCHTEQRSKSKASQILQEVDWFPIWWVTVRGIEGSVFWLCDNVASLEYSLSEAFLTSHWHEEVRSAHLCYMFAPHNSPCRLPPNDLLLAGSTVPKQWIAILCSFLSSIRTRGQLNHNYFQIGILLQIPSPMEHNLLFKCHRNCWRNDSFHCGGTYLAAQVIDRIFHVFHTEIFGISWHGEGYIRGILFLDTIYPSHCLFVDDDRVDGWRKSRL